MPVVPGLPGGPRRAAGRRERPGRALAGAGGALASVVQDAFSVFEQAMKTQDQNQNRSAERPGTPRPGTGASDRGESGQ